MHTLWVNLEVTSKDADATRHRASKSLDVTWIAGIAGMTDSGAFVLGIPIHLHIHIHTKCIHIYILNYIYIYLLNYIYINKYTY